MVLDHVVAIKERGIGVIFISHNIHHVYPIADRFIVLDRGLKIGEVAKEQVSAGDLIEAIVSGRELNPAN